MRLMGIFFAVLMFTTVSVIESGAGGSNTGVSPGEEALNGFLLAVGGYYRIPQTEVVVIRERGIPPYEIPVVLIIAKRAHVAPETVTDFRLRDNTWFYTTLRFGLGPEIFYVPMGVVVKDPLYSRVYGYYTHKPKKEWKTILLSDDDIINLVNLKLMSEHYRYPPEKVIKMRSRGKEFVSINEEIKKERERELKSMEKKE
jgi:hypothetical protein